MRHLLLSLAVMAMTSCTLRVVTEADYDRCIQVAKDAQAVAQDAVTELKITANELQACKAAHK